MRGERNDVFFSAYIHMKAGSPRKSEELIKVKDCSKVIVVKLNMNTFRLEN